MEEESKSAGGGIAVASHPDYLHLIGQRVFLRTLFGSIRYAGQLLNNPKAGSDIWLGIEWDDEGQGKHTGTVDGVSYFACEFHLNSANYEAQQTNCCSFIRHGKIQVGGVTLQEAIIEKYRPDDLTSKEEKDRLKQVEDEDLYVNTDKKGMKKIEVLGQDKSYKWRSDIKSNYEIALEYMKISDIGPRGAISSMIPSTQYLYLDKNMLYSWDQFFQITRELRFLNTLVLTGNKFKRLDQNYLADKKVEELINPHLKELILIDMALDWGQIDILAPTLMYVEQLHLVRSHCKQISTKYQISKEYFKNLKFLNLEQNGIESWDEIVGFRSLPVLKRLTVSKNRIREIYHRPGFYDLYMITMEDNLISSWKSFDALNEFKKINSIRCGGNPVIDTTGPPARNTVIARLQFLKTINGSEIDIGERKDAELHYLKSSYVEYIQANKIEQRVELNDEGLMKFMTEQHPRFYELVEVYGSPLDIVSLKKEGTNIASTSAKIKLVGVTAGGKVLEKKLLLSMTVKDLKGMCAKLFKIEVIKSRLVYRHNQDCEAYELDEEYRTLSFYSIGEGGEVHVDQK